MTDWRHDMADDIVANVGRTWMRLAGTWELPKEKRSLRSAVGKADLCIMLMMINCSANNHGYHPKIPSSSL